MAEGNNSLEEGATGEKLPKPKFPANIFGSWGRRILGEESKSNETPKTPLSDKIAAAKAATEETKAEVTYGAGNFAGNMGDKDLTPKTGEPQPKKIWGEE